MTTVLTLSESPAQTDLDAILAIEEAAFVRPWGRLSFTQELTHDHAFNLIARSGNDRKEGTVIAYLFFHLIADEMHVLRIAVAPGRRGAGIASQMLRKGFQLARDAGVCTSFLEVRPSNRAALALYRKLGFQRIGTRPGYYADTGEEALVLMKQLKEAL